MRQLCLCLFVELNTVKVSGSKTVGGVAKGVTVLINLVWIDMHTEGASSSLCLFPGKDFRFRLPAVPEKFSRREGFFRALMTYNYPYVKL